MDIDKQYCYGLKIEWLDDVAPPEVIWYADEKEALSDLTGLRGPIEPLEFRSLSKAITPTVIAMHRVRYITLIKEVKKMLKETA